MVLSKRKTVLVDVDLTVVDVVDKWVQYMNSVTGKSVKIDRSGAPKYPYDLPELYKDCLSPTLGRKDLFRWWNQEGLYDDAEPIEGSVRALKALHDEGFKIVFASHCEGSHALSKYNFLERHFPFMEGFAATREKGIVSADIMIDDRNDQLNQHNKNVCRLRRETPFLQTEYASTIPFYHWDDIYTYAKQGRL